MLRTPKPSDWAAEDDDADAPELPKTQPPNNSSSSREAPRNRWDRAPAAPARRDNGGSDRRDGGYDRRDGGGYDRRDGGYDRRDGGGYDRRDSGGYDRRDGGGYDRRDGGGYDRRDGGGFDRREGGGYDRRDGGGGFDRRDGGGYGRRQQPPAELPVEQGVVIAIKESFGFVSCMDRDGDLFFHITEAPLDVQLQDEVEFRVKFNQRSSREMACQLVALPKGTIVQEDVAEEFLEGVVTRGLRSAPNYSNSNDARQQQRDDAHGLIEIVKAAAASDEPKTESEVAAAAANPSTDESDGTKPGQVAARPQRNTIRFNADSINSVGGKQEEAAAAGDEDGAEQDESGKSSAAKAPRRKKPTVPHYGDEVRFRVATHRRTGVKRAVELTVTVSAKAKLEKEIEGKLATMVRELGVVDKLKAGGGFIKCCDRLEDVYFPLHEVRASNDEQGDAAAEDGDSTGAAGAAADGSEPKSRKQGGKKPTLREGDEVSFFVYEEKEDESGRSKPRLTALRVQRVPKGSVSFEDLLRANVEGVVSKSPKEPRNGPEVIGSITPNEAALPAENKEDAGANEGESQAEAKESAEGDDAASPASAPGETTTKKASKKAKDSNKKKAKAAATTSVVFRLSDTHDMSYSPIVGDVVLFDEVLDKRSGKSKAVNVRVVQLNAKNRERGVITALRDDFGFIKCADRAVDAYFRFSEVMAAQRDIRLGLEVAFDVNVDPTKPEHARATRVEILPKGTVQWEVTVEDDLVGEVVVVPSGRVGLGSAASGGRGKGSLKVANGRVRFMSTAKKFWLDFLPDVKEKIDSKFVLAGASDEQKATVATGTVEGGKVDASSSSESEKKRKEIRLLFPVSLSTSERFAIHQYCDALGIQHQSSGEGASRRLELVASAKVPAKSAAAVAELPALELDFKMEDLAEVRYSPQVGDRVRFHLMQSTRTKQFLCKSVVCVESVTGALPTPSSSSSKKKSDANAAPQRGEGFIVAVRNEGFGFIQPANVVGSGFDDSLFFHIKEVTTGETLESLKVGMEVAYTPSFDEVKKKTRALGIAVLPAGTIKKAEPQVLKGVVTRPSFLQPLKAKGIRFTKNAKQAPMSTIGKIRAITEDGDSAAADAKGGDEDNEDAEDAGGDDDEGEREDAGDDADASETPDAKKKLAKAKTPSKAKPQPLYAFNIKDIADPSVVLREGDEVEFTTLASAKGLRASKIRVVALHAKQGVVLQVHEDLGGVIRVDAAADGSDEAAPTEIPFSARNVLRGDVLGEGDRVEFSVSTRKVGAAVAAKADAEADARDEGEKDASEEKVAGGQHATSVLRLSAGGGGAAATDARARAPRTVNSSLLQAMRDVGASATVASRMATGPDGTRGFKEGWRTAAAGGEGVDASSPEAAPTSE